MSIDLQALLKTKAINEWRLYWLIAISMSIVMVIAMMGVDLSNVSGVRSMIQLSVRWAVPCIFLVVAASAVQKLFPGPFPMWLQRNSKYIGFCFATAMAWQGLFIFIMSNFFRDYYFEEVFLFRDELEGSIGYIFLTVMVVTSFDFGRKYLTPQQWKLIHLSAVYYLFAYPFAVYWWNLFVYEDPLPIDYVYYWAGFLAFALRIVAWGKERQQATKKNDPASSTPLAFNVLGGALIAFGLTVAASGLYWVEPVTAFVFTPQWSADLYLWLPFWPFRPFYSLFIIGLGVTLISITRTARIEAARLAS
jgi:DMSO/TMAO reductase YedYZ heme-binding membrane subunit